MIDEVKFIEMYKQGERLEDIVNTLGVTTHIIKSYANSLSLRFANKYREEDLKALEERVAKVEVDRGYLEDEEDFSVRMRAQKFYRKALEMYGETYAYNLESFKHSKVEMDIYCSEHGKYEITPIAHLEGSVCPTCTALQLMRKVKLAPQTPYKQYYDAPTTLYYIKVTEEESKKVVWKVGITTKSVVERFTGNPNVIIEVLKEHLYDTGEDAYRAEQAILRKYQEFRYKGPPILKNGNSELFSKDIFEGG